jgi:putative addiction module component (TIGR02574 family)
MSERSTKLVEEALALPPEERAELVDRLLTSLDVSPDQRIDELWAQEAEDRLDAFEQGEIKAVSAEQAFDAARGLKR